MTKRTDDSFFHWENDNDDCDWERHCRRRTVAITFIHFWENFKWAVYKHMMRSGFTTPQIKLTAEQKFARKIRRVLNL